MHDGAVQVGFITRSHLDTFPTQVRPRSQCSVVCSLSAAQCDCLSSTWGFVRPGPTSAVRLCPAYTNLTRNH